MISGVALADPLHTTVTTVHKSAHGKVVTKQHRNFHGELVTKRQKFSTQDLTLDQQTYASVAPLPGETVGVGMPVIVDSESKVKAP